MTTSSTTHPVVRDRLPAGARERFERLTAEWKRQSRHLSNTAQMAMLKPYPKIIGMHET